MAAVTLAAFLLAALAVPGGRADPAAAKAEPLPKVHLTPAPGIGPDSVRARLRAPGYDGRAAVKVRGQWSRTLPKKSYAVELRDGAGENQNAPLLGLPADDDWVLYAAYNDRTLMRNVLAEKLKLHEHRVQGGDDGFLRELTSSRQAQRKDAGFVTPVTRRPILWDDPNREDLTDSQARRIVRIVGAAERALHRGGPGAWRRHLHARSAVDFVLRNELFKNHDGMHASVFMTGTRRLERWLGRRVAWLDRSLPGLGR